MRMWRRRRISRAGAESQQDSPKDSPSSAASGSQVHRNAVSVCEGVRQFLKYTTETCVGLGPL